MKPVVTRNLMLEFIPEIVTSQEINPARVFKFNDLKIKEDKDYDIFYLMGREFRIEDNWGFLYAYNLAKELNKKIKVLLFLDKNICSDNQIELRAKGVEAVKKVLTKNSIECEIINDLNVLKKYSIGALVFDFNPILPTKWVKDFDFPVFEVDSHNIIPARNISDKQEFSAATLRRKVYGKIGEFLTEFPNVFPVEKSEAQLKLKDFIQNKLDNYAEEKNDPNSDVTSHISKYLHFGQISAQRVVLEVLKSDTSRENKEVFLEELIVRKELTDNFCLYNREFKSLKGIHPWATETLEAHRKDIRTYIYSSEEFEYAKTHDDLWNAIQRGLLSDNKSKEVKIHGFLRMYWAKKILEWSISPEEALKTAIYLNDKYALDGNDSNGYVGILWSIGGVHDRPFSERLVTGKIRYMSLDGCKKKFDVKKFIENS